MKEVTFNKRFFEHIKASEKRLRCSMMASVVDPEIFGAWKNCSSRPLNRTNFEL